MQGVESKLDKAWHGKSAQELAGAPVSALKGVSDGDADLLLKAFNIKTVKDLGTNKYFLAAQAIAHLSE
ncbi:MAG TPA: hypothetical protein VKB69_06600 [Micromonosporaceae bacterium]|nr:hypothetical protein [Micromonosporaceae bacterium]